MKWRGVGQPRQAITRRVEGRSEGRSDWTRWSTEEGTHYGRRAGEEGWMHLANWEMEATLRWGPGGGAGLGKMLRPVWDTVGVRSPGSLKGRHPGGHGSLGSERWHHQ